MTRKQSLIVLTLAAVALVLAAAVVYRDYFNEETDVYLAFLDQFKGEMHPDATFLSFPSTCGGDLRADLPEASSELLSNFLSANRERAEPISLKALAWSYNIVSLEGAKLLQENRLLPLFRLFDGRLIRLSRVGFDPDKTHALFCTEPGGMGALVYLVKEKGTWKFVKFVPTWVN